MFACGGVVRIRKLEVNSLVPERDFPNYDNLAHKCIQISSLSVSRVVSSRSNRKHPIHDNKIVYISSPSNCLIVQNVKSTVNRPFH